MSVVVLGISEPGEDVGLEEVVELKSELLAGNQSAQAVQVSGARDEIPDTYPGHRSSQASSILPVTSYKVKTSLAGLRGLLMICSSAQNRGNCFDSIIAAGFSLLKPLSALNIYQTRVRLTLRGHCPKLSGHSTPPCPSTQQPSRNPRPFGLSRSPRSSVRLPHLGRLLPSCSPPLLRTPLWLRL